MKTAIIIATHRRPRMLERLLQCLAACALPGEVAIRVVENGPRTGVEAICAANPVGGRVEYAYLPVGAKSLALNRALQASSDADLLIFFDDDVTFEPDIVATYVSAAQRRGPGWFFGGGLIADAETTCPPHLVPYLPLSAIGWSPSEREWEIEPPEFQYFFGANWAVFRSDLSRAGLFLSDLGITASRFSPVGEETEIQKRLVEAGVRPVYVPRAHVRHPVPRECYTEAWVWRRRFRIAVAEWKLAEGQAHHHARRAFGVPLWLVRALVEQKTRVLAARLTGRPAADRMALIIEEARLAGLIHGARLEHAQARIPA